MSKALELKKKILDEKPNSVNPKIYETLDVFETLKLPLLQFQVKPTYLRIMIWHKRKLSAQKSIPFINGDIALEHVLSQLEIMAGDCGIDKLRLFLEDEIFKRCTANTLKIIGQNTLKTISIIICATRKLITCNSEKMKLIQKFHDDPLYGGHCGQKRLVKKLKALYKWKNMSKDIAKYIRKCHKCQTNKAKVKNLEPMTLTPTPQKAFDIVSIDTIGPFQKSNQGHIYAVTIQCELTKFVVIIPMHNKEASTVAKAIFESFILVYGPMKEIRTDMGSEYRNQIFENLSKLIKIDHKISTAYHSQTIGTCERNHRVFNEYARMYINDAQSDWDTWTRYYAFCYNTTPSSYHNYTPYELVFAKRADLDSFLSGTAIDPLYNIDAYDQEVRFRLQSAHKRVGEDLDKAKRERKLRYDNKALELDLKIGDYVTVTNEARTKLNPLYKGPFPVVSIDGPNCIIDNKGKQITVHKNRVQKYVKT